MSRRTATFYVVTESTQDPSHGLVDAATWREAYHTIGDAQQAIVNEVNKFNAELIEDDLRLGAVPEDVEVDLTVEQFTWQQVNNDCYQTTYDECTVYEITPVTVNDLGRQHELPL